MKLLIMVVSLFPAIATASGYEAAKGSNEAGEVLLIDLEYTEKYLECTKKSPEEVCSNVDEPIMEEVISVSKGDVLEKYSLTKECQNTRQYSISCPRSARFPLAGTKYIETTSEDYKPCDVEPYFNKGSGKVYKCVEGCNNPRAPKIFYVQPWECG